MAATPPADTVQPTESSAPVEVEAAPVNAGKNETEGRAQQDAPADIEEQVIERMLFGIPFGALNVSLNLCTYPVKPVTVRLPSPSYSQTLPKSADGKTPTPSTFIIHPQPSENIQDIRAILAEWTGGYWLGPYSLRLAGSSKDSDGRGKLIGVGKEGTEIREGERLSDWLEIGEVFAHLEGQENENEARVLVVQREPYSEQDARQCVLRLREYMQPPSEGNRTFAPIGVAPGATIFEGILDGILSETDLNASTKTKDGNKQTASSGKRSGKLGARPPPVKSAETANDEANALFEEFTGAPSVELASLPVNMPAQPHPACLKSLIFSPFNPPAPQWRQRGHLVYLTVVTLEGEAAMLVCTTRGWHVARSTAPSLSFDPEPRPAPKDIHAHSLVDLLHALSPLFTQTLRSLQSVSSSTTAREPIATVPVPQYPPAYPWIVKSPSDKQQQPDLLRTQLAYGYTGATSVDGLEGARDWNEELQNAREMPRSTHQERIVRERMLQKTHTEFTAACVRGAMAIARGDLPPINPYEDAKAHMWLANNIFFTKGVNSVDAYTHLGGDEAAHISHAKDAVGVKMMNKLDIENVYLLGHTIVDWQGERWVCQSVLPGIFTRRKDEAEEDAEVSTEEDAKKDDWVKVNGQHPSETSKDEIEVPAETSAVAETEHNLIIYGADSEAGASRLHWNAGMHKVMAKIASAHHLASHTMKDAQGKEYEFWTSVDVKGLRGSDGRRYLLDLPRLSPVDIEWLEKDMDGKLLSNDGEQEPTADRKYPHRVALLRPELLDAYWDHELKLWARKIQAENAKKAEADKAEDSAANEQKEKDAMIVSAETDEKPAPEVDELRFDLRFNADAFVDQQPPAGGETSEQSLPSTQNDESVPSIKAVRDASVHLRSVAIPAVVIDIIAANTFGIMDGASLSKHLHSRGINMRYLGYFVSTIDKFIAQADGQSNGQLKAIRVSIGFIPASQI